MHIDPKKELVIQKSVMHILDNRLENGKTLSDVEMDLNSKIKDILKKHVINSVNDEYVRFAKFEGKINVVKDHCQAMLDDDKEFIKSSQEIADYLYDSMKDRRISPAYLVLNKIKYDNQDYISLLKLDFNENLTSHISKVGNKRRIDIIVQGTGVPNEKQKLHKCIFFKSYDKEDTYDIILLDRQTKVEGEIANFFAHSFLHCKLAITDRDNTRNFCDSANEFVEVNFADSSERTSELKRKIISTLEADSKVNLKQFAEVTFGDNEELQQEFINYMGNKTIDIDFNIDKPWVEENIKRIKIVTDTGIEIKVDNETFNDKEKFLIRHPYEDKTKADIIIKNVTYKEKPIK